MVMALGLCFLVNMVTTCTEMGTSLVTMEYGKERYQSVDVSGNNVCYLIQRLFRKQAATSR